MINETYNVKAIHLKLGDKFSKSWNSSFLLKLFCKIYLCEGMLTEKNIDKYYNTKNDYELQVAMENDNLIVNENWNQYDSLEEYLRLLERFKKRLFNDEKISFYLKKAMQTIHNSNSFAKCKNSIIICNILDIKNITISEAYNLLYEFLNNNMLKDFINYINIFSEKSKEFSYLVELFLYGFLNVLMHGMTKKELLEKEYLNNSEFKFFLNLMVNVLTIDLNLFNKVKKNFFASWISINLKYISECIFKEIENDDISKQDLLKNGENYFKNLLENEGLKESDFFKKLIESHKELFNIYVTEIFKNKYFIDYPEIDQDRIIDNTCENVISDTYKIINEICNRDHNTINPDEIIKKSSQINNILTSIKLDINNVVKILNINNLKSNIEKNLNSILDYHLTDHKFFRVHFEKFKKERIFFKYYIVDENNVLPDFYNILINHLIFTSIASSIKNIKSEKNNRAVKFLEEKKQEYKSTIYEVLIDKLIAYQKNSGKSLSKFVLEVCSKSFCFEYLENDKFKNRLHNHFSLDKNTIEKNKGSISNDFAFHERTILFSKKFI